MKTHSVSKGKVTLRQIAEMSGVSVSTASRVLSCNDYPVSDALRQAVLTNARESGYFINHSRFARPTTAHPAPSCLAIIIPSFQNPFFTQMIAGAEIAARQLGITPIVMSSQRSASWERAQIRNLIEQKVGMLIISSVDNSADMLQQYLHEGGYACVMENSFDQPLKALTAKSDMVEAGLIAANYLLSMGHTSIAFASPPLVKSSRWMTLDGCRMALARQGLFFAEEDIVSLFDEEESEDSLYEFEAGKLLAQELLRRNKRYTAVIAVNDMVACGLIYQFQRAGLRLPEDISVIGFDNITYGSIVVPNLTTVDTSAHILGQKAVELLTQSAQATLSQDNLVITVPPRLVVRDSVQRLSPISESSGPNVFSK